MKKEKSEPTTDKRLKADQLDWQIDDFVYCEFLNDFGILISEYGLIIDNFNGYYKVRLMNGLMVSVDNKSLHQAGRS